MTEANKIEGTPFQLSQADVSKGVDLDEVPFVPKLKFELLRPSLYLVVFAFISGILLCAGHLRIGGMIFVITLYLTRKSQQAVKQTSIRSCLVEISANPNKIREFLLKVNAPQVYEGTKDDSERSQWVNDIVSRLWPFINSTIQKDIDSKGYSDRNKGMDIGGGTPIQFERFTLGDKPPVVTHMAVNKVRTRTDELVIEMKVLYFGNSHMSFARKTLKVLNIKAGVQDVYFRGNGRLVMRPLLDYPPYFGGYTFCLLERPILDYDGINLANLADNRLFKNFLYGIIDSLIVSPNKLYFPMIEDPDVKRQLKLALPTKLCYFEIIEAENLPKLDSSAFSLSGLSDPFCIVKVGGIRFETPIVYNSIAPYWGESHSVPIHDVYEMFKVEVYDKDTLSADDFIGSIEFQIKDIVNDKSLNGADKWLPLGKAATGTIHFRVACFNLTRKEGPDELKRVCEIIERSKQKFPLGVLSIYIYNLNLYFTNESTQPVVQLKFSSQAFQTDPLLPNEANKAMQNKIDYIVDAYHHFLCNNLEQDSLDITVVDAAGVKLSKLAKAEVPWSEIIGSYGIRIDTICKAERRTIDQTFELCKGKDNKNSRGSIRVYISLQLLEDDKDVQANLQKPIDIKCRIDQPTSETSFIRRILMQPSASISHPIKTLKTLKNTGVPFIGRKAIPVLDDRSPAPQNVEKECIIKIRLKWPERSHLYVEILRIINVPSVYCNNKYKFSVTIRLGRSEGLSKARTKPSIKRTGWVPLSKEQGDVVFNERLSFTIAAHQYIDNYEAQITLKAHSRKSGGLCWDSNEVATTLTKIPSIPFRSDPVERWFKLTGSETRNPSSSGAKM